MGVRADRSVRIKPLLRAVLGCSRPKVGHNDSSGSGENGWRIAGVPC